MNYELEVRDERQQESMGYVCRRLITSEQNNKRWESGCREGWKQQKREIESVSVPSPSACYDVFGYVRACSPARACVHSFIDQKGDGRADVMSVCLAKCYLK